MGLTMFNDAKAAISMGKMDGLLRRRASCEMLSFFSFFFLHCRAITRHCRSTGILMRKKANYGRNSLEARKQQNKTNTTKNPNKTSTKHQHHRQGNSQNKVKQGDTRPSQPLIGSLPPCSNPPGRPLFRCQPYLHLHLHPQAGLERQASVDVA